MFKSEGLPYVSNQLMMLKRFLVRVHQCKHSLWIYLSHALVEKEFKFKFVIHYVVFVKR